MSVLLVTYPKSEGARFDGDYYVAEHLRIVREGWSQYGLTDASAMLPSGAGDTGMAAMAILTFRDDAAMQAALASPETAGVMADVPRFTDIQPAMHFMKHG